MIRLQKYLAAAGVASRRGAEKIISEGRVSINDKVVREMGMQVDEYNDVIKVDGQSIKMNEPKVYIMLNKPVGFITTVSDEKGRETVMDLVSDISARIYPVGRLDYDTEGLLLMTNDGNLTYTITHPKNNISKTYVAEVSGNLTMETITQLRRGVVIDGYKTSPAEIQVVGATQYGTKLEITIHEGKNRQVRKMFESLGCTVKRLKRVGESGLSLGKLPLGKWRKLSDSEINMLKKIGTDKPTSKERSKIQFKAQKKKTRKNKEFRNTK